MDTRMATHAACATLLLLVGLASTPWAAEVESGWLADSKGCKIYNPSPKPNETLTWSGPCLDGIAEGKGTIQYSINGKLGARYEGSLKRGKFDGRGRLKTSDGAVYDGDWSDGQQDGYGEYTAPDGATYRGGWTAGKPDGPGVYTTAKGEVTSGVWANGQLLARYPELKSGISRPSEQGERSGPGDLRGNSSPAEKEE